MNTITFSNVLPKVFSQQQESQTPTSEVWRTEVVFERGNHYLIEADSGKGKSTLCSYILGYRNDYEGLILFDSNNVTRFSASQWTRVRRSEVSCLFQELRLFPELTALDNVLIKNRLTHHKKKEEIERWFSLLGLTQKIHTPVALLSFGQQQRVAAMRALAQPFSFLLADEPVSHLDDHNALLVAQLFTEEAASQGASIIATSIGRQLPINYNHRLQL